MDYLPPILKKYNIDLQPTNSVMIDVETAKSTLYPGAHVAVSNPYEHYHHGIIIDTNESDISIIHFWGSTKSESRIQQTTLPIFIAGGINNLGKKTRNLYLINYVDDNAEKRWETVKKAKETLDKADDIAYDYATANCESFACFCRTGEWSSEQIEKLKKVFAEKIEELSDQLYDADEENKKCIGSMLKTIPINDLSPAHKAIYNRISKECESD